MTVGYPELCCGRWSQNCCSSQMQCGHRLLHLVSSSFFSVFGKAVWVSLLHLSHSIRLSRLPCSQICLLLFWSPKNPLNISWDGPVCWWQNNELWGYPFHSSVHILTVELWFQGSVKTSGLWEWSRTSSKTLHMFCLWLLTSPFFLTVCVKVLWLSVATQ